MEINPFNFKIGKGIKMKLLRIIEFADNNSNGIQRVEFFHQDDNELSLCFTGRDNEKDVQCDLSLTSDDCKELVSFIKENLERDGSKLIKKD